MLPDTLYRDLLNKVEINGTVKSNRTGVDTKYLFGHSMAFDVEKTFPLLTSRKMFLRGIFEELMFFLRGQTDTKILEAKGVNIWKKNTSREFLDKVNLHYLPEGEMGCGYSHQWRNFAGEHPLIPATKGCKGFDQVKDVINLLQNDPLSRRMIISAWCPTQLEYTPLPPCHVTYIFSYEPETKKLNLSMTQRSTDIWHGLPFNMCSTALMLILFSKVSGLKPGKVFWTGVDNHYYIKHQKQVCELLDRLPFSSPTIKIHKDFNTLDELLDINFEDIEICNYKAHPKIDVEMVE